MKILLIGVDGQLGNDINAYFSQKGMEVEGLIGLNDSDICEFEKTKEVIVSSTPDLIINTAAFHNVDLCEDEAITALQVNIAGVKNLATICRESDIPLMHFSTDYIFDGEKGRPYIESDCPNPLSLYGISKLGGERVIQYMLKDFYLIRLTGLYGHTGCVGKGNINFVEMMIKLGREKKEIRVVDDQVMTPTSTMDVTEKLYELILTGKYGIYHMTNTGSCSWYEFALEIFRLTGMNRDIKVLPISSKEFGAKAIRPGYSVLDNYNLRKLGIKDMRNWKEALRDYIEKR